MPHIHVQQCVTIPHLPQTVDEISFIFLAHNINYKHEKLIAVKIKNEAFFILCIAHHDKYLLKADKTTRPTSTYLLHKALLEFTHLNNLQIISSNIPNKSENQHLKNVSSLKNINFFTTLFPIKKQVIIEIGFGSGRHLLYQAQQHVDKIFIGIEIHRASLQQVIKQINIQNLTNIYLLDYDARLFLELLPSNTIEKIYIHFPVPWDKKPQRRVISQTFVDEVSRVLKQNGTLELRTDSQNYYDYAYNCFIKQAKVILKINKNIKIDITSKYEARWQKLQKNIYDIIMIKDYTSQSQNISGDFNFHDGNIRINVISNLQQKTIKFDQGFVHLERYYKVQNQEQFVIRVSMGSFDRPEHLYLILSKNQVQYFPKPPLRSKINLHAHKILNGLLHG